MTGILSNKSKMQAYSDNLFSLLQSVADKKSEPMIFIFTLQDIDFSNKTVYGNLIKKDNMEMCTMPIPDIIFNLSYQQKNSSRKKLKLLSEQDNVILINEANQFSQSMIMEMLASSPQIKPMLLSYKVYHGENNLNDFFQKDGILVLPEKGTGSLKKMWLKSGCQHAGSIFHNQDSYLTGLLQDSKLHKKKLIIFDVPDLLTYENRPVIITLHLQKSVGGDWEVLNKEHDSIIEEIDSSAAYIAKYINCFLPSLAFCTITFVLDKNYTPFFINLRGWDPRLLLGNKHDKLQLDFVKNLLSYNQMKIKQ